MARLVGSRTSKQDKRPAYPKRRTCNCKKQKCGTEPEWEWQGFEDVWTCLGCGMTIEGKTGKDVFAPKEDAEKEQALKPTGKKFKKGDKVAIAVHGVGVTSYEPHIVERIHRGVVCLEGNEGFVFDANTGWRTKCEPSPFGFSFQLVTKAEVPTTEWKRRCKDFGIAP